MARGTINIGTVVANAGGSIAATAIDTTNGLLIPAGGLTRNLFARVKNTGGTAGTISIQPGDYPPAFRQSQGTVTVTVPANGEVFIGLESARLTKSADGSVYMDFTPALFTGTVDAYRLDPAL
jgi:hypothetical protein